jgi:hypothetical protein
MLRYDDIISPADIDRAEAAGACAPSLQWLRAQPRTVGGLVFEYPEWALWAERYGQLMLPDNVYEQCARRAPGSALMFTAGRLARAPELLAEISQMCPELALEHASGRLPPELFVELSRRAPLAALRYAAAALPQQAFRELALRYPSVVLQQASAFLMPELLEKLARWCPGAALQYAREFLSPALLAELESGYAALR